MTVNMADSAENMRQDASGSSRPVLLMKPKPRTQPPEQLADHNPVNPKKSHKRSPTMVTISGERLPRDHSPGRITMSRERPENGPIRTPPTSPEKTEAARNPLRPPAKDTYPQVKSSPPDPDRSSDAPNPSLASESEGSSGSSETVTVPQVKRDGPAKGAGARPRKHHVNKLHALNFLDSDSPEVTSESIQRTVKEALKLSPEAAKNTSPSAHSVSSASTGFREDLFDAAGDHETDRSTSPEHSVDGDLRSRVSDGAGPRLRPPKGRKRNQGSTPEMPRANLQHPHMFPEDLTPRAPNQHFAQPLPRAEKLPLTGYELLASRLSATAADQGARLLRPIYRRFEALNHRMLLHLQDEICELEEQLHRLDTADTQNRRLPNGILPASRRAEYLSSGELQWHKTDVLGKIGFKLEQYNRVLSSFRQTLSLSPPTLAETHDYRSFLASYAPISEIESHFLDATDDLVCLGYSDEEEEEEVYDNDADADANGGGSITANEEEEEEEGSAVTPTPRPDIPDFHPRRRISILSQSAVVPRRYEERTDRDRPPEQATAAAAAAAAAPGQLSAGKHLVTYLSVAMAVAIMLPLLTFLVIPGFIGRMTVVSLVGVGILGALVQGRAVKLQASQELCVGVGLYGGVMAALAAMVG
ncbi:hypothetical protein F5Y14DRAFT_402290 [Nemania sp. NC0429]|nr:hypothetical protein F5Y14DRAFT_402290 [Nemania sp. NC0429]